MLTLEVLQWIETSGTLDFFYYIIRNFLNILPKDFTLKKSNVNGNNKSRFRYNIWLQIFTELFHRYKDLIFKSCSNGSAYPHFLRWFYFSIQEILKRSLFMNVKVSTSFFFFGFYFICKIRRVRLYNSMGVWLTVKRPIAHWMPIQKIDMMLIYFDLDRHSKPDL